MSIKKKTQFINKIALTISTKFQILIDSLTVRGLMA